MTDQNEDALVLHALIASLKDSKDGGFRITFDIPESDKEQFKALVDLRGERIVIAIGRDPILPHCGAF